MWMYPQWLKENKIQIAITLRGVLFCVIRKATRGKDDSGFLLRTDL